MRGHWGQTQATRYALFLHAGSALAAAVFYREELLYILDRIQGWRPRQAFDPTLADLPFFGVATLVSSSA